MQVRVVDSYPNSAKSSIRSNAQLRTRSAKSQCRWKRFSIPSAKILSSCRFKPYMWGIEGVEGVCERLAYFSRTIKSKYNPLFLHLALISKVLSETEQMEKPGGRAHPFCTLARATSIPSLSTSIFTEDMELTISTRKMTSGYFFII